MKRLDFLEFLRRWLPRTGGVAAFAFAGVLVTFAVLLRFPLDEMSGAPLPPYITLYPAIVIAAFAGGVRVGMAAMLASALAAWLLWLSPPIPGGVSLPRAMTGAVFLFTGTVTVLSSGLARVLLDEVARGEAERAQTARESVHRIRNLIAIVQAVSRKIGATAIDVADYRQRLEERLNALAIAQNVLVRSDNQHTDLIYLIRSSLAPFLTNPHLELRADASALVPKEAVTTLSMALYELATNSMKYGGLASPSGLVRVETRLAEGLCYLEWRELGLAQLAVGDSAGLGSHLIRAALAPVEGAMVHYDVSPQSVSCLFVWPLIERGQAARS